LSQGANLYWYVGNNAVNAVDPTGLAKCCPSDLAAAEKTLADCNKKALDAYNKQKTFLNNEYNSELNILTSVKEGAINAAAALRDLEIGLCNHLSGLARALCIASAKAIYTGSVAIADDAFDTADKGFQEIRDTSLEAAKWGYEVEKNACCFTAQSKCDNINC
jgi:hypothetical protein